MIKSSSEYKMKAQRLQAQFIAKRESEQARIQSTNGNKQFLVGKSQTSFLLPTAVQKYYDQWGRIASRHEHWSTPDYYHEADEKMRRRAVLELKQKVLSERQEKLKILLQAETAQLDNEVKGKFIHYVINQPGLSQTGKSDRSLRIKRLIYE